MLKGKTTLITGSSRGIGKSILELFASNGSNIIACSKNKSPELIKFYSEIERTNNIIVKPYFFDFSDNKIVSASVKKITSENKEINILINNAGEIQTSLFLMTPIDKIKENFDINFFSQLIFTQNIIKKMIRKKTGNIINISSTAAIDGIEGRMAYSSSKASLITSTKVLSKELGSLNIRVNAIAPGLTNTELMHNSHDSQVLSDTVNRISLRRIAEPKEIANVALFLASDLSSYITGEIIRVDGGM